jgi:GAF domain-containing protein
MTVESLDLAVNLARAATQWDAVSGLDATLTRITEGVRQTIPEVACASITTRGPTSVLKTLAPTHVTADQADQLQYEAAEGPCYQVVTSAITLSATEDLATEDRWPNYAPSAVALGVRSQIAVRVYEDGRSRAGLNLYSSQPGIFDSRHRQLVALYATHAAIAMGHATALEQLNQAVLSHKVIGPAIGILMERYSINENAAFEFLIRTSQNSNTKLRTVASELVSDGHLRGQS